MSEENDRPLMPCELADLLGCSPPVVYAALKRKEIPFTRLGRRIFIPRSAARKLLEGEPLAHAS